MIEAGKRQSATKKRLTEGPTPGIPTVYFDQVLCPAAFDEPRIKIGESSDHKKRLRSHGRGKFGVSFDVSHLCVVRGTREDEQRVLRYFEKHKLPSEEETFWPASELVDYIRWLRDQYFVWVPDCDLCPAINDLDVVSADLWMPKPERQKKPPTYQDLFGDFGPLRLPPRDVTIDDFYTNEIITDAARRAMGGIDLDPASHAYANMKVRAAKFFTVNDNGLTLKWEGRVWVNPPFSDWAAWVSKIIEEWNSGRLLSMCVLCATRTLTAQYFAAMHKHCTMLCVLKGRIPFWGGRAGSPDDGHAVFYFGDAPNRFAGAFETIGHIYGKHTQTTYPLKEID